DRAGPSPLRAVGDRWPWALGQRVGPAHRRGRGGREAADRRPGGAAARVERRARDRARSGPRRDPPVQGAGAQLPPRSAAAGGAPRDRRRRPGPPAHPPRYAAWVPGPAAARRRSGPRRIRAAGRRIPRAGGTGRGGAGLMRLHRLRLLNFRQHADTELVLGPGITGIIGPNGSGKTTLLEAMAWAIYGNVAARGDKDSIRNLRAKARSSVRVEMEFGVGAHEYKVIRGLHNAELYRDGQLAAELHGREVGLPEPAALERERATAAARLEQARRAAAAAQAVRTRAQEVDAREAPRWQEWVEKEKRVHSLDGDRRMAEQGVTV